MAEQDVKVNITAEDKTDAAFRSLESNLRNLDAGFARLATAAATFAGGAFIGAIAASIKAAEEAEVSQRKLEAILRATGNASGYTADQLGKLAENLARSSRFDDNDFKDATTTILRFGNIAGENLERVLRLSADYAALTGGSLVASAEKLARALSNPAEGLKKLERNFGDLSPEIERAIKDKMALGDRAGALGVSLEALEAKIGGSDAYINTGLSASFRSLGKTLNNILETLGRSSNGGAFSRLVQEIDQAFLGLKRTLSDESLFRNMGMIATFLTNPQAFLSFSQIGGMILPNVRPDSTVRVNSEALAADLARMERELADSQQAIARRTLREAEKLNREREAENERYRQLDLRGWVAYAQAIVDEDFTRAREMAKISEDYFKEQDKQRERELQEYIKFWVAVAEARIREGEEELRATNEITQRDIREKEKYWEGFLGGIEGSFRSVFDQIFKGQINTWRDFVGALRDIFKRVLLDFIYQSLARPFVLNVVASLAGAAGFSGLANAAGTAAAGNPIAGLGSNLLGSAAAGSGFGFATAAEFFAGMTGSFMGPTAAGSAASMGAQFAAFMTNPVTLAILAAVVIAVAVQARRGGPKEGGSFFGTFDGSGSLIGPGFAPGTQNGRFYTPSGGDPFMRSFTEGIGSAFADALTGLGGSANGFGFGFGYDRDPRGTAQSRVSGVVTNAAGERIFEVINREVGRGDEDFQAGLELLGRQSVLAALQNSQLPEAILAILRLVDAASASADEIDSVFKLAVAFRNLTNLLSDINVADIVEQMGRTSVEVFQEQGRAMVDLANRTSLTTESIATLTAATGAYRTSAIQLIAGLEQASRAIEEMFGQTARNIRMSGMSDAERFRFLEEETTRLLSLLSSAGVDDISRLTQLINQNIGSAFSLLSPEEQAARRQEFLTRLDEANAGAQERLRQLQQQAAEEANRQLSEVRRIMEELAVAQKSAADTQQDAANKQLTAANTPKTLNINVDVVNGSAVVTES